MASDILERLSKVVAALSSAKLHESRMVVQEAFNEIVRLRNEVRVLKEVPVVQPDRVAPPVVEAKEETMTLPPPIDEIDDGDEEPVPSEMPRVFALKLGDNGQYFQAFQFAEWDTHLNRVGSPDFPGVWNEKMAKQLAECFSKLGAPVTAVDVSNLKLHRG